MFSKFVKLILVVLILILCVSCSSNQKGSEGNDMANDKLVTENHSALSPSEKYLLEMAVSESGNVRGFYFVVKDASNNKEVYKNENFFRLRDTNYLFWGEDDTVWVYSGDLGTFYWEKTSNSWDKKTYAENKDSIEVPELLKELKPQYFK